MKRFFVIVSLFLFPLFSFAKVERTINGTLVNVPEPKLNWIEKRVVLPSGFIWSDIIGIHKAFAEEPARWDSYPLLKRICGCESTGSADSEPRQFLEDGSVLWGWQDGKMVKRDVGMCQINIEAHAKELKSLHLDVVQSLEDNLYYAKLLFDREGERPWKASKNCWGK